MTTSPTGRPFHQQKRSSYVGVVASEAPGIDVLSSRWRRWRQEISALLKREPLYQVSHFVRFPVKPICELS